MDILGCSMIIASVVLVAYGGSQQASDDSASKEVVSKRDVVLSIVFGLCTGLSFSLNTLNINYLIQSLKYPTERVTLDGNVLFGLGLIPFFYHYQYT